MRERLRKYLGIWTGQQIADLPERLAAMAVEIFFVRRYFRRRAPEVGKQKHGIVTETVCAARLLCENSFDEIGNHCQSPAPPRDGRNADESRAPFVSGFPFHRAQQLTNAIGIRRVRPCIARGMNAGRPAERRHDDTRVVRENRLVRELAVVQRLPRSIFRECRRGLFKRRKLAKIRKQVELQGRASGEFSILAQFAWIRRCEEDSNGADLPSVALP
jgi:hypothetical protein